jgi:hypothetical protein
MVGVECHSERLGAWWRGFVEQNDIPVLSCFTRLHGLCFMSVTLNKGIHVV